MGRIEKGPGWELRLGRWQDVLADVQCDALITDPPYHQRTVTGFRSLKRYSAVPYAAAEEDETARALADLWTKCGAKWFVATCDHLLWSEITSALEARNAFTFPPLPWLKPDGTPRLNGDGPACTVEWIAVGRRRGVKRGSLPGYYMFNVNARFRAVSFPGAKPVDLMRAVVRDYTDRGQTILEPYTGTGTTLLAAAIEGRQAIGAECDPNTFELAVRRLRAGYTPSWEWAESEVQP